MQDLQKTIQQSVQLENTQRFGEALNLIHDARRKAPGSRPLAIRLAQLFETLKQPESALQIYQQLADIQPENQEPALVLGMARSLLATSQVEPAGQLFERLQDQLPPHADVLTGLGDIRRRQGKLQEAREFVDKALALSPGYKPAVHQLAELQLANKETEAGIATLESNALREDQHGDSLDLWLTTLRELKRERYVQEKLEQAAARWPDKVEFIFGLAVQAHRAGEVSKALPAFEKADKLSPDNHRILHEWGVMERMSGDIGLSQKLLARSLELNPEQPAALRTYGTEHKYAYGDKEFTRLNYAAAKLADVEVGEQVHLHYALGKAFEDVSELDTAFRHYETAGSKKRKLDRYDERNSSRMFQVMPQVVNAETRKLYSQEGFKTDTPVFILGMPRSGTSLMEQILSSHPDVFGAGELKFLPPAVDNIRYGNNRLNLNEPEPAFPYEAEASWEARGRWYVEKLQALADKPYQRIVDKMPGNFTLVGLIGAILPNARIIHSRRHPVETCLSNYRINFAEGQLWSYNLRELGRYYKRYWALMKHWREQYPGLMYEVMYEENVADVEGQARKLIDYLGLPWHEGCLEFYNTDRPVRTASASQVRKPIYTTSTNRWRKFEKYLGPLLEELGDVVTEYEAEIAHLKPKK
jgi:tetratricopeptide (TPR) repeat protein